ncbi:hypothetical protein SMAC4_13986 [Sordaria macrospora]|uniref:WGS project CABT00000000 data, contig 2.143 n=1 Tax=Sordaria macrospora (strain ATCC MYA-333 / DSM 997 / K(L3346) / K-hell) TaxID=771870 RepID=F7WCJ2_SORMK|nr:uncharacterized protein SMAC_09668 [Sordaria macrospora k-hell]WPJ65838.1 hypothetical protein SMAC4_13986 [Sordaria macrospora]CCC05634.1 unnamed protein product [Sordaria macrospora k-hell]
MSFNAATLIPLKGESNLDAWARALKVELASQGLKPYVTKSIPEPKWMMDRAKAMSIIHSTIRDKKVQNVLSINSWDEDNDDPKYPFDFIKNSISSVTNEAKSDVLNEYQTIKCASFATLESLRKRVKDVGYKIDDTVELTNLFNAVKHSFPNEALLWAADKNKNKLTTITFLARLSTLANTQKNYTNMVAAKVEVKTKEEEEEE